MPVAKADFSAFLSQLEAAARAAGDIAMSYFRSGARTVAEISYKGGGSPVTEADFAVDRFLFEKMRAIAPEAGWLSEETADTPDRLARERLIIVDPIDGTHAFTRGDARWAVSIALIERGRPVAGVIHAPALGETYRAAHGAGAALNDAPIAAAPRARLQGASIVAPRGLQPLFESRPENFVLAPRAPSLALRLAEIAARRHDLVVAAPHARDWDIAAADIILAEAGARLGEPDGAALTYNRAALSRNMLVAAPATLFEETLALARSLTKGSS